LKKAQDFTGRLPAFLEQYAYQPSLTAALDGLDATPFDQARINEIVLWKVNRYAPLSAGALEALESVSKLRLGAHRSATRALETLLEQPGVDLAMASTFLRFRNPDVFQIIDRHAYRAMHGTEYPLHPGSRQDKKVELYFEYLDALVELARKEEVQFKVLDRVLYCLDRAENGAL
jgi:thermostable 8-oxoguanine DNA glycosylase